MDRRVLRDDQWERIAPLLPGKATDCGVTARDNRRFLEGVLWIARTGAPWRDLPPEFGNSVGPIKEYGNGFLKLLLVTLISNT